MKLLLKRLTILIPLATISLTGQTRHIPNYRDSVQTTGIDLNFSNKRLELIMDKVSKAYHKRIVWKDNNIKGILFSGQISKAKKLPEIIRLFELAGPVKFSVVGNQIFVGKK